MFDNKMVTIIKEKYPAGTRLRLDSDMNGERNMSSGLEGTVTCVDDIGSIHMVWDNGRTLALIPIEDSFSKVTFEEQNIEGPQMNM